MKLFYFYKVCNNFEYELKGNFQNIFENETKIKIIFRTLWKMKHKF
jgi:hypothetical protein